MPDSKKRSSPVPGMQPKVAVVGTGALGKEHARIYADMARQGAIDFVGVFDSNVEAARQVGLRHDIPVLSSFEEALDRAEALSVVTPTHTHFELAKALLEGGKHVLVEKPMTDDALQAAELVALARGRSRVLQVGHVERFNPVFRYLQEVATQPKFIESHRLSPYPARSTDIGVVLDLMIHDLDVVLAFVDSPVERVDAVGIPVLSASEDIANARIKFANGCVANLTASRISPERMRKIRVFSGGPTPAYVSLDYRLQSGYIYRLAQDGEAESSLWKKLLRARDSAIVSEFAGKRIVREPVPIQRDEPLKLELSHFIQSVQAVQTPQAYGESAKLALDLALEITRLVQSGTSADDLRLAGLKQ